MFHAIIRGLFLTSVNEVLNVLPTAGIFLTNVVSRLRYSTTNRTKEMAAMEYGVSSSRKYPAGVNPVDTEVAASWAGPNWINGATDPALGIFVARLVTLGKDRETQHHRGSWLRTIDASVIRGVKMPVLESRRKE